MSKEQKVYADYFNVTEEKGTFVQILDHLHKITNVAGRNYYIDGVPMRLDEVHKDTLLNAGIIEGDMIKIRMDNIPSKASVRGSKKTLGLNDDEGLGEETAFLYDSKHKIAIIQRNRRGTTYRIFEQYFNSFGIDLNSMITFEPIICPGTIEKMESANSYRKLIVKVQPFQSAAMLKSCGPAVGHAIDAMKDIGGEKIEICVSLSRSSDKTLNKLGIQALVKKLLKCNQDTPGSSIQKLQMTADIEDTGVEPIDFLRDRVQFSDELESDSQRQISYTSRKNFLRRAWRFTEFQNLLSLK